MKNSNNKLVVTLLIAIVCFIVGGSLVYTFTSNNDNSNGSLEENENKELSTEDIFNEKRPKIPVF